VIDIHCHILADVDDGPNSWEVAEEMCRIAAADGIEHIVATPHANTRYEYDRKLAKAHVQDLQRRIGPRPSLSLGCDFHLSYENFQHVLLEPAVYTIEGGNYLLVELSNYSIPAQVDQCFKQLGDRGITPVLTHPERNPILQQDLPRVLRWVELGCAVQVTGSAVTGDWGERVWRAAEWLLKRDAVHVLASDGHDTKHRRPVLSPAREAAAETCSADVAKALVDNNPRAIISGQALPYFPNPVVGR
jgi:protein-tyrosine phosphatase